MTDENPNHTRSTDQLQLPCPAKLNLFLHILGQREDGYHLLQTIFQLIDYGDSLQLETIPDNEDITLTCNREDLETADNLVVRAARTLQTHCSIKQGAHLILAKNLPCGGGLGGGSSDAASTLLGLNLLWGCGLSLQQLAELGAELGADIPVFILGKTAWAEGIGDELSPINIPDAWYLVICPPCEASTVEIFSHSELTRHTSAITIPAFPIQGSKNDCEPIACQLYPEIREALIWLNQHSQARMTGTGASIFAAFSSKDEAEKVLSILPDELEGFVARGIDTSPAHEIIST